MHSRPQTVSTSPTQVWSQLSVQQKLSTTQMMATQLGLVGGSSQPETSAEPVLHAGWAQVPALSSQTRLLQVVRTGQWLAGQR